MARLTLHLFGPPRLELDGQPITTDRRKALALLAYLAVTRQSHSRETLATLLWPDYDQSRAFAYLRRTMWEINQMIAEGWIEADRETIGLKPDVDLWIDVAQFQKRLGESRQLDRDRAAIRSLLREAAELYADHFLAGFNLKDAASFDEWTFFQAESLRRDLEAALVKLVDIELDDNDAEAAIPFARRWLSLDPLNEAAHRQLMQVYEQAGQHSAALRQYQECVQILQEELKTVPDPATTTLYEQIKREGASPKQESFQRHNLPLTSTSFIGRVDELAQIATLLSNPDCRLLTLVGPGGVGKTRIALQATQAQLREFADGVFFVALAPIGEPASIVSAIADAIGFSFFSQSAVENQSMQARQLLNYLSQKQMLLVLDNFEHLLLATSLLTDILRAAPRVRMLVTSRERLNVTDEWALLIEGMRVPAMDSQEDAEGYSAVQLFVQNARRVVVGFALTEAVRPFVIRICQLVEGLPLGLELAATWVKTLTCREIAAEIERGLDFLTSPLRDTPERHQSLRAVFDYSWGRLSLIEQAAYRRLSVFRGGFDRAAAQVVANASLPALSALVDKSLLYHRDDGRYELHEVLRQYAAGRLDQAIDDAAQTRARHSAYYAGFVETHGAQVYGREQQSALEKINGELENVLSGWHHAIDRRDAAIVNRYLDGLAWFLEIRSRNQEAITLFGDALAALDRSSDLSVEDTVAVGRLLAWQGHFLFRLGRTPEGCRLLRQSLNRLRPLGERAHAALIMTNLHVIFWGCADGEAEHNALVQTNMAYYHDRGLRWGVAQMLQILATTAEYQSGDLDEAIRYYREALRLHRELGDNIRAARTLNFMGEALHHSGKYGEALQCYQESLDLARVLGDRWTMSQGLDNAGYVARRMGDFATARQQHEESLALSTEIGDVLGIAGSLDNLGLVAFDSGDYVEARRLFDEGLALRRTAGWDWSTAVSLTQLAAVALMQGDEARADQLLQESVRLAPDWPATLIQVAELQRRRGNLAEARATLMRALQTERHRSETPLVLECLTHLAALKIQLGDAATATEWLILVLDQPATDHATHTKAQHLLDGVSPQLSAKELIEAETRARSLTLEAIAASL